MWGQSSAPNTNTPTTAAQQPIPSVTISALKKNGPVPSTMKGMLQHLTVTGSPNTSQTQPQANAVITLKDFAIEVPNNVTAGAVTWKVTNDGPQLHEMDILKLHSGVTFEQFQKILSSQGPPSGPPPFDDAGGMAALQPGTAGWMKRMPFSWYE